MMIINKRWEEGIKSIENETIDLIVTDPPYFMMPRGAIRRTGFAQCFSNVKDSIFDGGLPDRKVMMSELYRVLVPTGHCYIFAGIYDFEPLLRAAFDVGWKLCNVLPMAKNIAVVNSYYMKTCEYIFMFRKKRERAKRINNCSEKDITNIKVVRNKINPTEKPLNILRKFIVNSSNEDDLVLDIFAGSCSTGEACAIEGREFIGFETDKEQVKSGKKRIRRAILQKLVRITEELGLYEHQKSYKKDIEERK